VDSAEEELLPGGNVAAAVVRVGSTVRKPAGPATPAVEALHTHLAAAGCDAAPRTLGRDSLDRHVLEYVPGPTADTVAPLTAAELNRVGTLVRRLHDAAADFTPPADARWQVVIPPDRVELACHHDLAPWKLVLGADRWVFIDWDGAGPGSRLWDLAYAATGFVFLPGGVDPDADGPRLRALVDGYRLDPDQRRHLPALITAHTRGMVDLLRHSSETGVQPWARLHAEGHAQPWQAAADFVDTHHDHWVETLLT